MPSVNDPQHALLQPELVEHEAVQIVPQPVNRAHRILTEG